MSEEIKVQNKKFPATFEEEKTIYEQKVEDLAKEVKFIHGVIAQEEKVKAAKKKEDESSKKDSKSTNTKSAQQVIEILSRLEGRAGSAYKKSRTLEERFKVPELRFAEIDKLGYKHFETEIAAKKKSIKDKYHIEVSLIEDIDIKESSKEKFYIEIKDMNGNFTTLDLVKYQESIYSFDTDEELVIKDALLYVLGTYTKDSIEAAKDIADYISIALAYKDTFDYKYRIIGWDILNGDVIFKYDKIYSNHLPSYNGFCSEDWATNIVSKKNSAEDRFIWFAMMSRLFSSRPDDPRAKADIVLCAAVSGVLRQALTYSKETNINMNIKAAKGTGKSSMQHFVLSFFANPEQVEGSFVDTETASARIRSTRSVLPYMLDERMLRVEGDSSSKKVNQILLDIFKEYEGKIKEAVNSKDSGLRAYGAIISSSVESVYDTLNEAGVADLGQYRRFIEIVIEKDNINDFFASGDEAKAADNLAYNRYGYGMPILINYMLNIVKYAEIYRALLSAEGHMWNDMAEYLVRAEDIIDYFNNVYLSEDNSQEVDNVYYQFIEKYIDLEKVLAANQLDVFDTLFGQAVEEVKDIVKNYENGVYYDEMESSVQRFALLYLTGLIINRAFASMTYEGTTITFEMNMDSVVHELCVNFENKIVKNKIMSIEHILELAKEKNAYNVLSKYGKQAYKYEKLLFRILDWMEMNKDCFYQPNVNDLNKKNRLLGAYRIEGGDIIINIPNNKSRKVTWDFLISHLSESGESLLKYQYEGGSVGTGEEKISFDELVKNLNGLVEKSDKRIEITGANGLRGPEYRFFVNNINSLREALK